MKYLSVCSGIEAVTVAWQPLGWQPVMFAEIDPFCCWLLRSRYGASRPLYMPSPNSAESRKESKRRAAAIRNVIALPHNATIPNFGDFTRIGADDVGAIDLLAGGTPCQSFSIAGKRAGLDDARGNLTLEFARLADRLRPLWLVWENVPGVLSIDGGRTFGAFLSLLVELGYGIAYRVLDAQYFGVPQRRRRVFVVGHLGDVRRETGKELRVKVPDSKELAIRAVPESCVSYRKVCREALTGVCIGQPLSRERDVIFPGADALFPAEGNTDEGVLASPHSARRGHRPWHVHTLLTREPGDLLFGRRAQYGTAVRIGKARSRSR